MSSAVVKRLVESCGWQVSPGGLLRVPDSREGLTPTGRRRYLAPWILVTEKLSVLDDIPVGDIPLELALGVRQETVYRLARAILDGAQREHYVRDVIVPYLCVRLGLEDL